VFLTISSVTLTHPWFVESVKLENCVLGKNTKVGTKAELVRCVTQAGFEVEAGGSFFLFFLFVS
jgi:translation initiation factor eIF-2B subunit gamma